MIKINPANMRWGQDICQALPFKNWALVAAMLLMLDTGGLHAAETIGTTTQPLTLDKTVTL